MAAHLVGRDAESTEVHTRAHHEFLRRGDAPGAARCAFWLAFDSLMQGEPARSSGWLARGQQLLDNGQHDCVERGYLLLHGRAGSGFGALPGALPRTRPFSLLLTVRRPGAYRPRLRSQSMTSRGSGSGSPRPRGDAASQGRAGC
jgi:hypothetical protein